MTVKHTVWNYRTKPQKKTPPPEYVKRNLEAQVNKKDVQLNYSSDIKRRAKRLQKHDRPEGGEGPKGS